LESIESKIKQVESNNGKADSSVRDLVQRSVLDSWTRSCETQAYILVTLWVPVANAAVEEVDKKGGQVLTERENKR
jgi:hypothetical protein